MALDGPAGKPSLLGKVRCANKDKLLLGPGESYIQDPHLLREGFPDEGLPDGPMGQGRILDPPLQVNYFGADPQVPLEQKVPLSILEVEPLAQVPEEDHGKFEALALVDAHQPHHIIPRSLDGSCPQVPFRVLQCLEKAQEAKKARPGKPVEFPGPLVEDAEVGLALLAPGKAPDELVIARLLVDGPDQILQGPPPRPGAKFTEEIQESPDAPTKIPFFLGCLQDPLVEIIGGAKPDHSQFIDGAAN